MAFTTWLALAAICIMGAISPGPSLALIMRNTVRGGRWHGMATGLGHGLGVGLYALIAAYGLALLLTTTPWLFQLVQYAGAAFLAWLGLRGLLTKPGAGPAPEQSASEIRSRRLGALEGFVVAFLNPQLAIFFVALFSQFVHAHTDWPEALLMMLTAGGIDALWYSLVAVGLSHGPVLAWLRAQSLLIERLSALVLLGIAAKIVL